MLSTSYNLSDFNNELANNHEKRAEFSRKITSSLKETINIMKVLLKPEISENPGFVVLEEGLAEFVQNVIDAFINQTHEMKNKQIIIKIPIKLDKNLSMEIQDTAGGFSKKFLDGKDSIDFFRDKLSPDQLSIDSEKKLSPGKYFGQSGFHFSQASRFLHQYKGSLTLENTSVGARMTLTSPVKPCVKKPSFNNFRAHIDYPNILAEMAKKTELNQPIELEKTPPLKPSQQQPTKPNKFGLSRLFIPETKINIDPSPQNNTYVTPTTPDYFFKPSPK